MLLKNFALSLFTFCDIENITNYTYYFIIFVFCFGSSSNPNSIPLFSRKRKFHIVWDSLIYTILKSLHNYRTIFFIITQQAIFDLFIGIYGLWLDVYFMYAKCFICPIHKLVFNCKSPSTCFG